MKKIKEFLVFLGFALAPIIGASAETKQGLFWTIFVLGLTALVAWDAGMLDLKTRKR